MKLLAFGDTHLSKKAVQEIKKKAKKADFLICIGDISLGGAGLTEIMSDLNKIKKTIYTIPGNHEEGDPTFKHLCQKFKHFEWVDKRFIQIHDYIFFFWGGGGFALECKDFEKQMQKFKKTLHKKDKIILVTHGPPHKTKLDYLEWCGHVGCKSQKKFLKDLKPVLHVFGHLHEHFNKQEIIYGKTLLANVGPAGTMFELE
jgi:uncharacterized protein